MLGRINLLVALCGAIIACALAARPASAQDGANPTAKPAYRWDVTLSLGTTSSGPAGDIEDAMRASGFDDTSPEISGTRGYAHPFSYTGFTHEGASWMIAAHYVVNPRNEVGLIVSDAPIGRTYGFHEPFNYIDIHYSARTVAPTLSVRLSDAFYVGVGPALYTTKASQGYYYAGAVRSYSATKVGALVEVGASVPVRLRFFVTASLQYRYVGNATIGPFESAVPDHPATLPATSVSFNHVFVSIGVGVRF